MLSLKDIYTKAHSREPLSFEEACRLYDEAPLTELAREADALRRASVDDPSVVTWQIDRNVNTTNVCVSGCLFCNFHCKPHQTDRHFTTTIDEYCSKIERMLSLGGDQLLLQGGMHPALRIDFYEELFRELKARYPQVLDAFVRSLDMAVHHRCRCRQIHTVCLVHHLYPTLHARLCG